MFGGKPKYAYYEQVRFLEEKLLDLRLQVENLQIEHGVRLGELEKAVGIVPERLPDPTNQE